MGPLKELWTPVLLFVHHKRQHKVNCLMNESFKSCYHHLSCRSVSLGPLFISLLARSWCYAKKISAHKYFFLHWSDQRHSWTLFQSFCVAMRLQWEYSSPKYRSNCNLTKRARHTNTDGSDRLRPFNQERLEKLKTKARKNCFLRKGRTSHHQNETVYLWCCP